MYGAVARISPGGLAADGVGGIVFCDTWTRRTGRSLNLEYYGNVACLVYMEHGYVDLVMEHAGVVVVRVVLHENLVVEHANVVRVVEGLDFLKTRTS